MTLKGSKKMFFKLCTGIFASFFLIIFLLEAKHGVVKFAEPNEMVLIAEIAISAGLVAAAFAEVVKEWREGEWFWRR